MTGSMEATPAGSGPLEDLFANTQNNNQVPSMTQLHEHWSANLFMMYAVGKLEAALGINHLILSTSSQRVS